MLLQKTGIEQVKVYPCVFREVMDGEDALIVCVHVDDLAVTVKGKETFGRGISCEWHG